MKIKKLYIYLLTLFLFPSCDKMKVTERFDNGNSKEECEIFNGVKDGLCKGYFSNGNIEYLVNYKNDSLNGKANFFHNNGNLHWEVEFDMGKKNGEVKYFDEFGSLYQVSNFNNNILNGESITYYSNSNVESRLIYKDGRLNGRGFSFYENGAIKNDVFYVNDSLAGFTTYSSDGKIIDHLIKYDVKVVDDSLIIKIQNKVYDVVGISIERRNFNGEYISSVEDLSFNGVFKFSKNELKNSLLGISIFELDSIDDNQQLAKVMSSLDFKYKLD